MPKAKQMSPVSGLHARVASDPRVGIFNLLFCLLWNNVQIAGSIGILLCCVLKRLFHIGVMNVCSICEASLSGKFGPRVITYFPVGNKNITKKPRNRILFFVCLKWDRPMFEIKTNMPLHKYMHALMLSAVWTILSFESQTVSIIPRWPGQIS